MTTLHEPQEDVVDLSGNHSTSVLPVHVPTQFIQLKQSDIPVYRARLLIQQNHQCAICHMKLTNGVLDHQHKRRKSDPNGVDGAGLVRGVLCDGCNRIEVSWGGVDLYDGCMLFVCTTS